MGTGDTETYKSDKAGQTGRSRRVLRSSGEDAPALDRRFAARRQEDRKADQVADLKSAALASLGHELRNPMSGIIGFAEEGLRDQNVSPANREYLRQIRTNAGSLMSMLDSFLDLLKADAIELKALRTPFTVGELLADRARAEAARGLEVTYSPDFPRTEVFLGDPDKIGRVLSHLIARSAGAEGPVRVEASIVNLEGSEALIRFKVQAGERPGSEPRAFGPGSAGLELVLAEILVEAMDGVMRAEDNLGETGSVSFTLPLTVAAEEAQPGQGGSGARRPDSGPTAPARYFGEVLVCEDNVINREILREHLTMAGLAVTLAENGQEGLREVMRRQAGGRPFDLIFMDIQMPIMDGMTATRKIKALGGATPIIAFTANDRGLNREEYAQAGFSGFLGKPLHLKELLGYVAQYCLSGPEGAGAETPAGRPEAAPAANPALDRALGLEQAGGNQALYESLLSGFVSGNRSAAREMMVAVRQGDLDVARRQARALKSAAAKIGATDLADAAAKTEAALTDGPGRRLDEEFRALIMALGAVLREAPASVTAPPVHPDDGFDRARARDLTVRLRPYLAVGDPMGLGLAGEIKSAVGRFDPEGELLVSQMESHDYDQANATLDRIRRRLED